jgi:hypothetical protein
LHCIICIIRIGKRDGYASLPYYSARDIDYNTDPNEQCKKSLESLFDSITTPSKECSKKKISRFDNNTLAYISLATTHLQRDIASNSAQKICLHSSDTLCESRKSMLYNIDWIIQYCMIEDNADAAAIFDDMEKYVQKCKLKLQEMILLEKNQGRKLGKLEFAAFDGKEKTRVTTKGICRLVQQRHH